MPFNVATYAITATKSGGDNLVVKDAMPVSGYSVPNHLVDVGLIETPGRQTRRAAGAAADAMAVTRGASLREHRFALLHDIRDILRLA